MARIRTIKPAFWQNEDLASVSEHARLLAIALLNHADDEGFFSAHLAVVRAACFPFDDDTSKVRRSIDELSRIGYLVVRNGSGKAIGHVVKFKDHQKVDRPQASNLRERFETDENADKTRFGEHSTNDRRTVDDPSLPEWNGREQGMEGKGESAPADAETLKDLDSVSPKKTPKRASFTPPTLDEVKAECRKRGNSVDPEAFWAHYDSNGWRQGNGLPLKNWRSAIVTWEKNGDRFAATKTSVQPKQLKPIGDGRLTSPKPLTPIGDGRRVG